MTWQDLAAVCAVSWAAILLARTAWRRWATTGRAGCTGCKSCGSSSEHGDRCPRG